MRLKNYLLMMAVTAGLFTLHGCDDDDDKDIRTGALPKSIQQDFATRFPNTDYVEWEYEKRNKEYKGEFMFYGTLEDWGVTWTGVETNVWYSDNGAWARTEYDMKQMYWNPNDTFISEAVRNTIAAQARGREIDLDAIDTPAEDYFLLEIDTEPVDQYVKIGFDGNVIP